jgi:hypothetical protein
MGEEDPDEEQVAMKIQITKPLGVNDIMFGNKYALYLRTTLIDLFEILARNYPFFQPFYDYREDFWKDPNEPSRRTERTSQDTRTTSQTKPLKLEFVIDKEYDRTRIIGMFRQNDPAGLESRARGMGVPPTLARQIQQAKSPAEYESALEQIVERRFQEDGGKVIAAKNEYTDLWRDLITTFTRVVMELTEHPWFYDRYRCVVSAFHPGLSDWYGNEQMTDEEINTGAEQGRVGAVKMLRERTGLGLADAKFIVDYWCFGRSKKEK